MGVTISAILVPLHDPLRLAEDIAVLDLASGGRLVVVTGLGYRPSEYVNHRKEWADRGRLMDEGIQAMLDAWTGEPFEYHGETVRVTPAPVTQPHPMLFIGGTSKFSARRAARFGLPFFPADHLPELEAYYYAQCAEHGTEGFCVMPDKPVMRFVTEDPDKAWAELGPYFFEEALTYANWQTPDIHSSVHSYATNVEELRREGIYAFNTPEECVSIAKEVGDDTTPGAMMLHPLCGGMPIDTAWECMQLYVDKVLPQLA
jgi:alkanesulfonate monooxygenase SsuD/methylene tetrahydromethanopterin reductase-like flavin-dependent oxidoreductase (luciferase family)